MIYIEKDPSLKNKFFDLEDELLVDVETTTKINAYVVAADSLVRAVIDEMEKDEHIFETPVRELIENDNTTMNFYALYDPAKNDVSLMVALELADGSYEEFSLNLTDTEKTRLIGKIEDYAILMDGMTCEEIIQDAMEYKRDENER